MEGGESAASQRKLTSNTSITISDHSKKVLEITFPRCCICMTGWYDVDNDRTDTLDSDKKLPDGETLSSYITRRRLTRTRPSHRKLYPLPRCQCVTKLAMPPLPEIIRNPSQSETSPFDVLSKIQIQQFNNLAVCESCLGQMISKSDEVIDHDYQNGQRRMFSIDIQCSQCRQKFMKRALEKLQNSAQDRDDKQSKGKVNWYDCVRTTIQLVGWVKGQIRCAVQADCRLKKHTKHCDDLDTAQNDMMWWDKYGACSRGTHYASSDDCYSFSSDSDGDDDWYNQPKKYQRLKYKPGELRDELMQKDPRFREEVEGEMFAQKLHDEENTTKDTQDDQERVDREIAIKLQTKFKSIKGKQGTLEAFHIDNSLTTKETETLINLRKRNSESVNDSGLNTVSKKSHPDLNNRNLLESGETPMDESLSSLIRMGFSKVIAERCLSDAKGDVEVAVSMLVSASDDFDQAGENLP